MSGEPPEQVGGDLDAETAIGPGHGRQRLVDRQADRFRILLTAFGHRHADITASAAGERPLFNAEIAQDGIVAATAALRPAHQFQEQVPLVPVSYTHLTLPTI